MEFLTAQEIRIMLQLLIAVSLGGFIGIEREITGKAAGVRTYALVALGSALFTIISREAFNSYIGLTGVRYDPTRIASQVVLGVGFIGGGLIVLRGFRIEGLTTAAGIWVAAAIGMAVGVEFYVPAVFTAVLVFVVLEVLGKLDIEGLFSKNSKNSKTDT